MSAFQKKNALDFKTQCGLGFDPQDDEIVVDFFCGGGGAGTGLEMGLGRPVGWFHMSPDCTHHSQAAGGQPRKREIRNLSWIGLKWAGKKKPRVISLENVKLR